MPSMWALRAVLGASLGLGVLDLAWLNLALAPRVLEAEPARPGGDDDAPAATPGDTFVAAARAVQPVIEPPAPPVAPLADQVFFETNRAELDAAARARLAQVAAALAPAATVVLEGHADHRGAEEFNRTLSKQRALAVQAHLVRLGIARARIRLGYAGKAQAGEGELWRDRRVDIQTTGGAR